jgi:hypothetical protein
MQVRQSFQKNTEEQSNLAAPPWILAGYLSLSRVVSTFRSNHFRIKMLDRFVAPWAVPQNAS